MQLLRKSMTLLRIAMIVLGNLDVVLLAMNNMTMNLKTESVYVMPANVVDAIGIALWDILKSARIIMGIVCIPEAKGPFKAVKK